MFNYRLFFDLSFAGVAASISATTSSIDQSQGKWRGGFAAFGPVALHELGAIDIGPEHAFDGDDIGADTLGAKTASRSFYKR